MDFSVLLAELGLRVEDDLLVFASGLAVHLTEPVEPESYVVSVDDLAAIAAVALHELVPYGRKEALGMEHLVYISDSRTFDAIVA